MARKIENESIETRAQEIEEEAVDVVGGDSQLRSLLAKQYKTAQDAIRYMSLDWDEYEDLLFVYGRNADNTRQMMSEGSLSSIVIERAGRVMAQLPSGSVKALGLQDQGKGLLMELVLEKYIFPNANEQFDLETKLFLWDMYSNVYGSMAMCYDWCDSENYTGPDCWLVPIRNFFPQQGRMSVKDCDFVFISTFVSRDYLQQLVEDEVPNYDLQAITEILAETREGGTKPKARDDYLRTNPMFEYRRRAPYTDTGDIEIVTKYEAGSDGRWIDFAPDFGGRVIRNIENPHQNGRIPVVLKYAMPSLDSIIGLGDMERGRYIQYAMDTTVNLQIDAQKLRTYPPIKIVNGNVVMPTVRFQPGAKWLMSNPTDITHHQFPDIDNNLNLSYQFLKGALSNVTGNTTSQTSAESNAPTAGKTPQAIKAQNAQQSTRDAIDLKFGAKAITELLEGFIDLTLRMPQRKPIELYCFGDEIAQIAENYEDIKDVIRISKNGKTVKITIKGERLKNEKGYQYEIDPTSTRKKDEEAEHAQLLEIWNEFLPNAPALMQLLAPAGKTVDVAELFTEMIKTGGIDNWKKIIKPLHQALPGQQPGSPGQAQGGAPVPSEAINIKDLPPVGASQMAAQAGLQIPPEAFMENKQAESELKTQQQVAVKQVGAPPQTVIHTPPPTIGDPQLAQAHAQIQARSGALAQRLQEELNGRPQ